MTKTLEEFIGETDFNNCWVPYSNSNEGGYLQPEKVGKIVAAEILRVAEEWNGMDAYEHGYDKPTDEHSCDNCRGRQCSAEELYDFLKSYINSKPANTEGGDGER